MRRWSQLSAYSSLSTSNTNTAATATLRSLPSSAQSHASLLEPPLHTEELLRMSVLLPYLISSSRPVLLVGPEGAGKGTIISHVVTALLASKGYVLVY